MSDINYDELPCAIHHVIEPHQDGSIWCPECWHTYWDDMELITTEVQQWGQNWDRNEPPTVDEISSCPLCSHDW